MLNQRDQEIYDSLVGSDVLSDATVEELTKHPDSVGYFAVLVKRMRDALKHVGFSEARVRKFVDFAGCIESVSGIDGLMKSSGFTDDFASAYKSIIEGQTSAIAGLTEYTKNACYDNEHSGIVFAHNLPINGSLENCFRGCGKLLGISDSLDLSQATSLYYAFYDSALLPNVFNIDCKNMTEISFLGGNSKEIHFTNCSHLRHMNSLQRLNANLKKVTGLNLSGLTQSGTPIANNSYITRIEWEGIAYNDDGETIEVDSSVTNYFRSNQFLDIKSSPYLDAQSLLSIVMMMYDYSDGTPLPSTSGVLSNVFSNEQKNILNEHYGESYIRNLIESKRWTY